MSKQSSRQISTDREVASAPSRAADAAYSVAEYRIAGAPGLVLRVKPSGHRSWVYWLKRPATGKWQKFQIGDYPAVRLARAKDESIRLKRQVLDGLDPFANRDAARDVPTLRELGAQFIERHAKPKKRSWEEDERRLEHSVYPALGDIRVDKVDRRDVARLLDAIVDRGAPVEANRYLALLRKLFNWALGEGFPIAANPALGLPARAKEIARTRTLNDGELRSLWVALNGPGFGDLTADALRLALLTGARIREVTGMARAELDISARVWRLPAERAKANRDITRPLAPMALAIVRRRVDATNCGFVFPSPRDPEAPIDPQAPTRALARIAARGLVSDDFSPHDLRRTCRTRWAQIGIAEQVAKKLLGHAPQRADVTASVYDQHTYVPEMREALQKWERDLARIVGKRARK